MPELQWRSTIELSPDREYVVLASRLPLRRIWMLPRFLRYTAAVRKQLQGSDGLVWYSLLAEITRMRFWTLSVWEDGEALDRFVNALPHERVMTVLRPSLSGQKFVQWNVPASSVPPTWDEARQRLSAA